MYDPINRQDAIDIVSGYAEQYNGYIGTPNDSEVYAYARGLLLSIERNIRALLPAQLNLTDEQAIEYLQSTGWMQNHDKQMYEMGLKKQLADDSDSYDSLVPSAQPEPTLEQIEKYCYKRCLSIVDNALLHKYAQAKIQPEIIHCGDCRYKDDGIDEDGIPFLKCLHGRSYGGTRINDFCSWAERRIDEED